MFTEMFDKVTLNIKNLSHICKVALHHMVITLKSGSFTYSLSKKSVANLNELQQRATKFMNLEELREYRNKTMPKMIPKKKDVDKSSKNSNVSGVRPILICRVRLGQHY